MNFSLWPKIKNWLPQLVILCVLGMAYGLSIAPGLTWANNGADGGDLITAAATGGVAHPTGYPTYLLLARSFQMLPVGSIAFRTNLLSLVFAILTLLLVYYTFVHLTGPFPESRVAGLFAALAFGLSPLFWSQAVITEVYTVQTFFEALLLFLLFSHGQVLKHHPIGLDFLIGLVYGLAMGNHLTTIFAFPLVIAVGVIHTENALNLQGKTISNNPKTRWSIRWKVLLYRILGAFVGLMIYLSLYFRARSGSPVNWGDPVTLKNLFWLVSGKLYAANLVAFPQGYLAIKLRAWVQVSAKQVGIIGLILGLWGLYCAKNVSREFMFSTFYLFVAFVLFSFIYSTSDSFVYLIFALLVLSLWVGIGTAETIKWVSKIRTGLGVVLSLIFFLLLALHGLKTYNLVDASKNTDAIAFGEKVMTIAPPQALVFTEGDKDSFTLWYYVYVLKQRQDMAVIVTNLLPYDWYRSTLRMTYPALSVPVKATESWKASVISGNKDRPVCSTVVLNQGQINCWQ